MKLKHSVKMSKSATTLLPCDNEFCAIMINGHCQFSKRYCAIKAAYDELSTMPKAKLLAKLAKHRNGDIAKLLIKAKAVL